MERWRNILFLSFILKKKKNKYSIDLEHFILDSN